MQIDGLQQVIARYFDNQEKIKDYINTLEDSIVSLAEAEVGSKEY